MLPYHVYTRVCDTNTPIEGNADPNHVEWLWKKRFGLHLTPFEKMIFMLQDKRGWVQENGSHYNESNPEFVVSRESDDGNLRPEFYAFLMVNESVSYGSIYVKYFGTTLVTRQYVSLDSGRYVTIVPDWGHLVVGEYRNDTIPFKYYIEDSVDWILHNFLFDENSDSEATARNRFLKVILLFKSNAEKEMFIQYAQNNTGRIEELVAGVGSKYDYIQVASGTDKRLLVSQIKRGLALKNMLDEWRSSRKKTIQSGL